MGNLGQIGIGAVIRDHSETILRVFSKHVEMGFTIVVETLALLETLCRQNLYIIQSNFRGRFCRCNIFG